MTDARSTFFLFHNRRASSCRSLAKQRYLVCIRMMGEDSGLQMSEDQRAAKVRDVGRVRLWDKPSSGSARSEWRETARRRYVSIICSLCKRQRPSRVFRFSPPDVQAPTYARKKMKRGGLVEFVLKVPVTMDRFSNLWWQEADRHG